MAGPFFPTKCLTEKTPIGVNYSRGLKSRQKKPPSFFRGGKNDSDDILVQSDLFKCDRARGLPPAPSASARETLDASVARLSGLNTDQLRLQWRNHLGGVAPAHLPGWLLLRVLAYRKPRHSGISTGRFWGRIRKIIHIDVRKLRARFRRRA